MRIASATFIIGIDIDIDTLKFSRENCLESCFTVIWHFLDRISKIFSSRLLP